MTETLPTTRVWGPYGGGYVVSDCDIWLPGCYETEEAARLAAKLPDKDLLALWQSVCPRALTEREVREAM